MAKVPTDPKNAQVRTVVIDQRGKPVRGAVAILYFLQAGKDKSIRMKPADAKGNSVRAIDKRSFAQFRESHNPKRTVISLGHSTLKILRSERIYDQNNIVIVEHVVQVEESLRGVTVTLFDQFDKAVVGASVTVGYDVGTKIRRLDLARTDQRGIASQQFKQTVFDAFRKGYRRGDFVVKLGNATLKVTKTRTTSNTAEGVAATVRVYVPEPELPVQSIIRDQNGKAIANAVATLSYAEKGTAKTLAMPATNASGMGATRLVQSRFEALRETYKDAKVKQGSKSLAVTSTQITTSNARQLVVEHVVQVQEPLREMRAVIFDQDKKPVRGAQLSSKYKFGKSTKTMTLPATGADGMASARFEAGEQYAIRRDYENPPMVKLGNTIAEVIESGLQEPSPQLGIIHAVIRTRVEPEPELPVQSIIRDQNGKAVVNAVATLSYAENGTAKTLAMPATNASGMAVQSTAKAMFAALSKNYEGAIINLGAQTLTVLSSEVTKASSRELLVEHVVQFVEPVRDIAISVYDQNDTPIPQAVVTFDLGNALQGERITFRPTQTLGRTSKEVSEDIFALFKADVLALPSVVREDVVLSVIESQRVASTDQLVALTIKVRIEEARESTMNSTSAKNLFRFNAVRPVLHQKDNRLGIEYQGELTPFLRTLQSKTTNAQAVSVAADEEAKHDFFDKERLEDTQYWPFISAMKRAYGLRKDVSKGLAHIKSELEDAFADHATRAQLDEIAKDLGSVWDQYIICILLKKISNKKHAALVDVLKAIELYKSLNQLNSIERFIHALTKMPMLPEWLIRLVGGNFKSSYPYVLGISDLLVVKEDWIGYQRAEIAHIENVMATETRTSTRRSLDRTETTTTFETERIEEAMKETSTSIHSAMSQDIESTISQSSALAAGVNVSASYGPSVSVDTNASFDFTTASEETTNSAQEYAQDLVERAVTNVSNRERNETVTVVLAENESTHEQTFTNTGGQAEHVIGVYRHIDQIWKAQVFNYGKRLMLDFVVPEPSVNWRLSQLNGAIPDEELVEPPKLNINPAGIDVGNYQSLGNLWGATNVPAPPDSLITVTKAIEVEIPKFGTDEASSVAMATAQLQIPDGYRGNSARIAFFSDSKKENNDAKDDAFVLINGAKHDVEDNAATATLQNHVGTLEVGVYIDDFEGGVVSVKVECSVSPETWAKWQNDVYDALKAANDKAIDAYNAAKKNKEALKAVQQETLHPDVKANIQKNELKRAVIALMREDNFDESGSIELVDENGVDFAEVDFNEAKDQGARARFFEEAFEWREMTYLFYPYFWARREEWYKLMNERDPDFNFNAFLQSGAARVNLAVRPGFEGAVMWFFATGQVWHGGPTPMIGDPLYVALVDEIVEAKGRDLDKSVPVGDPWTYTIPTSLVVLDPDDRMVPPADGSLVEK